MPTFKIPVSYSMYGTVEINAETIGDAIEYAENNKDILELPDDAEYIDSSYEIDTDESIIKEINNMNGGTYIIIY